MPRPETHREEPSASPSSSVTACYSVSAFSDPSVMPRVLATFAKRGLVPSHWHSRVGGADGDELQIDIQMSGLSAALSEQIAQAMRQIIYVERVLTSTKQAA